MGLPPAVDEVPNPPKINWQRTVHSHAHDITQNSSGRTNKGSDNGHKIIVQHETFSAKGPARVGVQNGNDNRHVSSSNSHGQSNTHKSRQGGGGSQTSKPRNK